MSKLIHIEASPLRSRSHTSAVANAFLEAYRSAHPRDAIEHVDLWNTSLPPFDMQTIDAKFAVLRRHEFTAEQSARWEALRDACHKRARPIIMTTLAMGAGMAPIALGLSAADSSFRAPMAMAVIGGLITSTVLSLLVVPAVFTYVDDIEHWLHRMVARMRGRQPDPADAPEGAPPLGREQPAIH